MSIQNYSYELLDAKKKPLSGRSFFKAKFLNVYYLGNLSSISPVEFPWSIYFAEDKKEFVLALVEQLNARRERANKLRKERRKEKKIRLPQEDIKKEFKPIAEKKIDEIPLDERAKEFYDDLEAEYEKAEKRKTKRELERERIEKIYEEKTPVEKELKVIIKKAPKRFSITQKEKEARGIFQSAKMKFKQTILDYNGVYNVNPFETSGFTDLKSLIASDFENLLDKALIGKKGQRKFIIKLITPRYNLEGKRSFDNKIVDADYRHDKRKIRYEEGEHSKSIESSSNYGFSLGRLFIASENKENIKNDLRRFLKSTMSQWENSLVSKYMGMYSKIDISGIMLEEVMESEELPF